jgi:hypothetical protein
MREIGVDQSDSVGEAEDEELTKARRSQRDAEEDWGVGWGKVEIGKVES